MSHIPAVLTPSRLKKLVLKRGNHPDRSNGLCIMEAAAWMAGEPHSDHPPCVSPVIGAFLRSWNDSLPTDEDRNRLLKPLLPVILDTVSTPTIEERRSYMALDWFIREHVPAWFDLTPSLKPSGDTLRAADEIVSMETAKAIAPKVTAAGDAAWAAARGAAWDAARAAAWDAAWDAAWAAARAAAWDAARAAAGDAAWAAAGAAARAAARAALLPTTERIQESAQNLVRRMAALKE